MNIENFQLANSADIEAIVQLVNDAYRPAPEAAGWTHESNLVSGSRTSSDQLVEVMSKPDSFIFVGLKDFEIVTCIHIEKDGNSSYIGMLAVNPALQGTGIGKQMLTYAENYAVEVFGSEKFVMVVLSARLELISFYLRRGYQKTGDVMDYPLLAGVGSPIIDNLKVEVLEKRSIF